MEYSLNHSKLMLNDGDYDDDDNNDTDYEDD